MYTAAAARTLAFADFAGPDVYTRAELGRMGCSRHALDARLAAGRWQRIGRAIVLHNAELNRSERWRVAVLNCGPRAVLASFSAAEMAGLRGWERDEVHVLAPPGVPRPSLRGLPLILHRTSQPIDTTAAAHAQQIAPALVLAAAAFRSARPASGVLAAGVQQRLVTAGQLQVALDGAPRTRHRHALWNAVADIAMGAEALSEIDFVRLSPGLRDRRRSAPDTAPLVRRPVAPERDRAQRLTCSAVPVRGRPNRGEAGGRPATPRPLRAILITSAAHDRRRLSRLPGR